MFINYIYYNKQNNLDPDLVVLDQSKQRFIMSSSDSELDEYTENFGRVPGEVSPRYWEDRGYGSTPNNSDTDEDGISPGVCKVCLCDLPDCECAEQLEKHLKYQAMLRRNAQLRRNNVLRRPRKNMRRDDRDAKRGGKSTQKPTLRTKPKVQPKQKKLAEPNVSCKQEGTSTSDHSLDHPLDQSDDHSHKTDIHENH